LQAGEAAHIWGVPHLNNLSLLRATFITYGFKRHMHDYFVIGMVEAGVQKFAYRRDQYVTLPTGLIVINPGEAHTGEAAIAAGFGYRALYPETDVLQQVASEVKGRSQNIPFFSEPVIHDPALFDEIYGLHRALEESRSKLEHETRYLQALARLVIRHAETRPTAMLVKREKQAITQLRRYIEQHFADDIRLADLASLVNWNPFYLLRAFRQAVGLPPHAYMETVRIREAQERLRGGTPIVQVAYDTGFSSQSHFTTTFKRLIGVTPGQYARMVNILIDDAPRPDLS
jgi:AraC-like DNA-binding protein